MPVLQALWKETQILQNCEEESSLTSTPPPTHRWSERG